MRLVHVASWSEAESDSSGADHCFYFFFFFSLGRSFAVRTCFVNICEKIMCIDFVEWNRCLVAYAKLIVLFALFYTVLWDVLVELWRSAWP